MRYLLDTNVLLRFVLANENDHILVASGIRALLASGHTVHLSPQSVRELWHVCTRSVEANGIGLSVDETATIVKEIRSDLNLLEDEPGLFDAWLELVTALQIKGAKAHDANHAAFAKIHSIDCVLTFDSGDFGRFNQVGIKTMHPKEIS